MSSSVSDLFPAKKQKSQQAAPRLRDYLSQAMQEKGYDSSSKDMKKISEEL
jgi:hypothetical protein